MEESECEDVLDDWFIDSMNTYKDLHLYQLEHPSRVIEWTSGKTVCVAGCRPSKNEILELRLPPKLFAEEKKGLCAERDFKVVHGGFTDGPVRCLRHIPGTRCLVTNDGVTSDLQVWDLGGDDSDVIRRTGSVSGRSSSPGGGTRIAAPPTSQPHILHGGRSCDVQLSQLTSGQTLYNLECDSAVPLSSLLFLSGAVFLAGCSDGSVYVADTRTSAAPDLSPPPPSTGDSALWWTVDATAGPAPSCSSRMIRLSSRGEALVWDLRNPGGCVGGARLDAVTRGCGLDDVTLSWSPLLGNCFAVSGSHGNVLIYDTSLWGAELLEARPLFEHRGHTVLSTGCDADAVPGLVSTHLWHPDRDRTLLSAASDGSVHVWDWVEQREAPPPQVETGHGDVI